jgi:hypothetical protein
MPAFALGIFRTKRISLVLTRRTIRSCSIRDASADFLNFFRVWSEILGAEAKWKKKFAN